MTERELFYGFYSIIRLEVQCGSAIDDWGQLEMAADAARAGFSNDQIMKARDNAVWAVHYRKKPNREPSRNSVAIQLFVHTFGRVTRGRA